MQLRLVPTTPEPDGNLLVEMKNVTHNALDLWTADGEVPKLAFSASIGNDSYPIVHRAAYRPCAGLCGWPEFRHLDAGSMLTIAAALNDLLFFPEKGPYTTLDILLHRGCSVHAVYEITHPPPSRFSIRPPHNLWLGRVEATLSR